MVSYAGRELLVTVPSLSVLVVDSGQLLNRDNFGFLIAKAGESEPRSYKVWGLNPQLWRSSEIITAYKTALVLSHIG